MILNPRLYEINTRLWIKQFGAGTTLRDVPPEFFKDLRDKGFDIIWMMGIWNTCPSVIKECCFSVDLVSAYNKSLKDWNNSDVIGSPYAIDDYVLNPMLGSNDDFEAFREMLNGIGLKLLVDFIPNHFSAHSHLINNIPELFLQGDEELLKRDSYTFYQPPSGEGKIYAHGRDPLFPPWTDTVQVNYFSDTAREFMTNILSRLSEIADGVRCDMAMLPLNNVFHNTWIGVINKFGYKKPVCEFWKSAIESIKTKKPEFIFMGEAYWDLEWQLQQLGFDFTYDKRLTDRLTYNDIHGIKAHLSADNDFQNKSVRFIENHDEARAVARFGKMKSLAAASVMSTIQGLKFYYDGQVEGKKIKLPLQLGRQPEERISRTVSNHYNFLFKATNSPLFREGEWMQLESSPASQGNFTFENFLIWQWKLGKEKAVVIINYSDATSQCRVRFKTESGGEDLNLTDLMTGEIYKRKIKEIETSGLFVELKAYQTHIFWYNTGKN